MVSLPAEFLNSLKSLPGIDIAAFIRAHEEVPKITSVRLNPYKPCEPDFPLEDIVPWCQKGFYLEERPSFTHDPLFHAGCYYVQEAGSMFAGYALSRTCDLNSALRVLDVSAAPGGKSTHLLSLLSNDSLLVSNEVIRPRALTLATNLTKWGSANTIVTNNNPESFSVLGPYFDVVLLDAPCSGSGLFRKQPGSVNEWGEEQVRFCSARQKKILTDIIPCLKEDGILIYCTCSYSFEENEENVNWLIDKFGFENISPDVPDIWGIQEGEPGYRFYPHLTKSEGFYCAILANRSRHGSEYGRRKPYSTDRKKTNQELEKWANMERFDHVTIEDKIHFLNGEAFAFYQEFRKAFYFRKAGVFAGTIKGKDFVPSHELALSVDLSSRVQSVELDKAQALAYLRKSAIELPFEGRGFSLMTYKGHGLGWSKILEKRVNNYLPDALRILS